MKRTIPILTAVAVLLASCGSDTESAETTVTTAATTTTAEPTTTTEAETTTTTEAETTTTTETETSTTEAEQDEPAADAVEVELIEWAINAPTEIAAGTVTFTVTNGGENRHEFAIARGDGYEALPQLENGAVDEEALGSDFLGRTETLDSGATTTITFDLEPGNYVFMCNIQFGPNSHASAGQVLSVVVT